MSEGMAKTCSADADHQRLDDRRGQGQLQGEARPLAGRVATATVPPSRSVAVLTTSSPTPRPDRPVTSLALLKPGTKIRFKASFPARPRPRPG